MHEREIEVARDQREVRNILSDDGGPELARGGRDEHIVEEGPLLETRAIGGALAQRLIEPSDEFPGLPAGRDKAVSSAKGLDERSTQGAFAIRPLRADEQLSGNDGAQDESGQSAVMKFLK